MAKTLLALFNLKDDVSVNDYVAWARSVDLPTVNGLKSVDQFSAYSIGEVFGSDARPPYQYFEIIDVNDMDQFMSDISTDTMKKVAGEFQKFTDDVIFLLSERL